MKKLDGKAKLKPHHIGELMESADTHIIVMYTDVTDETVEDIFEKDNLIEAIFTKDFANKIAPNTVITIATEEVILETLVGDIEWHSSSTRLKKMLSATGQSEPATKKQYVEELTKTIAVGRRCNDTGIIKDIETLLISNKRPKESVAWLNSKIEAYQIQRQLDDLRVHVNYTDEVVHDPNGWLTIDQMVTKGYATK